MVAGPTLTSYLTEDPMPRVEVFFSTFTVGTATVTVYRIADGWEKEMRGAVNAATAGTLTRIDFEVPFNMSVSYRAQMFDASGNSLGYTDASSITVASSVTWLHNPLYPAGGVKVSLAATTARSISRPVPGVISRPRGRSVGVVLAEPRQGVTGLQFDVRVSTLADADKVQALLGDYTTDLTPVICIRLGGTDSNVRLRQPLFLGVLDIAESDMDSTVFGGTETLHSMVGDESAPPAPGLFIPLLTAADINAYYATGAAANADNLTGAALNRRYDLAGYA